MPGMVQGTDEAIIEPCATPEAIASTIEGKTREQDHIELCWFHHREPGLGHTDVVSAPLQVVVQICDDHRGHGFGVPIDAGDAHFFALGDGSGDEGVEGELGAEGCVGEDGGGGGDGGEKVLSGKGRGAFELVWGNLAQVGLECAAEGEFGRVLWHREV